MTELEQSDQFVSRRLQEVSIFLQDYALGDFTDSIEIPEQEDEFTELLVGLSLVVNDFRELMADRETREADLQQRYDVIQLSERLGEEPVYGISFAE